MNDWIDYIRSLVFGNTIFQGWLIKRGDTFKTWKKRYFVLSDTKLLRYYEDEQQTKYKGTINVNDIKQIKKGEPVSMELCCIIEIITPSRIWYINAENEDLRVEWIDNLQEGKKVVNYDKTASIFVDINLNTVKNGCNLNINSVQWPCDSIKRIKFVLNLYKQWIDSNNKKLHSRSSSTSFKLNIINNNNSNDNNNNNNNMQQQQQQQKGIYDVINNDLKDYKNTYLINDRF